MLCIIFHHNTSPFRYLIIKLRWSKRRQQLANIRCTIFNALPVHAIFLIRLNFTSDVGEINGNVKIKINKGINTAQSNIFLNFGINIKIYFLSYIVCVMHYCYYYHKKRAVLKKKKKEIGKYVCIYKSAKFKRAIFPAQILRSECIIMC